MGSSIEISSALQKVCTSIDSGAPSAPAFVPQTLPADILILVFQILSTSKTELYAPLICSHVCAHWRQTVIETPLLWSFIDTSRGEALTRLWLSRSKNVGLDVHLWENPLECDLMERVYGRPTQPKAAPRSDRMIQDVKDESHRWRSLDIAFCTTHRIDQILEFLGDPYNTLHLESLTIGPTGSTTLIPSEWIMNNTRTLFQNIDVRCQALRIDTYPVCISPVLFSPRLTVLEVFSGGSYHYNVNIQEWGQILSLTPNLVHLRLVGFRHQLFGEGAVNPLTVEYPPTQLPALERLELSGDFILILDLFRSSTYPKLEHLLLDSLDPAGVVIARLALASKGCQSLRRLDISCIILYMWSPGFSPMRSLQEVTIFEMAWNEARTVIQLFEGRDSLIRIRLERIWDLDLNSPVLSRPDLYGLPPIELIDCLSSTTGQCESDCPDICTCDNSEGSNFSENSDFSRIEGEFPSSEESDSDESARSYGEDEGSDMGKLVW
ncbi:hypothetical protein FS749_011814 [Ceratobasidium sp. UAMH 11750]|nr:hypothetical protein FS749_011814 [Ceratobasidium sp. UAMH 11750]